MAPVSTWFWRAASVPVVLVVGYVALISALTNPWLQRNALYAHEVHTGFMHNLTAPERWGFAPNQVTPFKLTTPDNETLFAWHILPLSTYATHESTLRTSQTHTLSSSIALIKSNPSARIVINFHGNAGHVAQGWRTDTYLRLTTLPDVHVFTIDYRGFGYSTGFPTEIGLITDAVTLIDYVLSATGIDPSRITILGQSLGTAVASAVTLYYSEPSSALLPALPQKPHPAPLLFAGTILVAPFSSLPSLLLTYRIGGLFPVLAPLRPYPYLTNLVSEYIVDKWPSMDRLVAYVSSTAGNKELQVARKEGTERGSLQIVHAVNDRDISFQQSVIMWSALTGRSVEEGLYKAGFEGVVSGSDEGRVRATLQILQHGGHNRVVTYAPVALAILRAFEGR